MITFTTKEKRSSHAARRPDSYVHHPLGPGLKSHQDSMRKILRSAETEAKTDQNEAESKTRGNTCNPDSDYLLPGASDVSSKTLSKAYPVQKMENENPEEDFQRQPEEKNEEEEPVRTKMIQRQSEDEEIPEDEVQRQPEEEPVQARLTIGRPNDKYEQEADRAADQVMTMPDSRQQSQTEKEEEEETVRTKPLADQITPLVQKQEEPTEEEEALQVKKNSNSSGVLPVTGNRLSDSTGGGEPIPHKTRSEMETGFGADFSDVRIHRDTPAQAIARDLNAQAFTSGKNIYFNSGRYNPDSPGGKRLLAHELTHTIQQQPGRKNNDTQIRARLNDSTVIQKQGTSTAENLTAEQAGDTAPGIIDLSGKTEFSPQGPTADYFAGKKSGKAIVRFNDMAEGIITVGKNKDGSYQFRNQRIPLTHPLFADIEGFAPHLDLSAAKGRISGYVGIGKHGKRDALIRTLYNSPDLIGLTGFDFSRLPSLTNRLENGKLYLGMKDVNISLGGAFNGSFSMEAVNKNITFNGNVDVSVKQLASGSLVLARDEKGDISGKATVGTTVKNVSGSVTIFWNKGVITGEGQLGYQGEKFSGEVKLFVIEKSEALKREKEKKAPPGSETAATSENKKRKKKKTDYAVFGEGDLSFSFTDWLSGTAHVIIDHNGFLTVIGKITPQKEIELFPQKDYSKKIFKVEARASYGIPVIGNIFLFANVGMDAFANIGPGKLYNIVIQGEYSTDPGKLQNFSIQGSLNISAGAGLRLRGEGGAGLEILAHDIKAGAGINAIAAIRAYADATPVIGYREKKAPGEDKKGEFFIRGDLEIAAQPFLGLGGDLFVEVDAPWWSPCPDKKWTWPLFNREWPIGGTFGLNASVDYTLGSKEWPSIEFKPVEFNSDKFMTDLFSDKSQQKSKKEDTKGKWQEKNTRDSEPSKSVKKGDAKPGALPEQSPAKSKAAPGIPKKTKKPVDPNARTAEGKTVKEYQEEAAKKGNIPDKEKKPLKDKPETEYQNLDSMSVEQVLSMPPARQKRSDKEKQNDLAAAKSVTEKIVKKSKTTADVEEYFPGIKKRFHLEKISFRNIEEGSSGINIEINPKAGIDNTGNLIWEDEPGGIKHESKVTFGGLDNEIEAATEMTAKPLSPDHPQGGPPEQGSLDYIMNHLITDPHQPNDSKYIRGHLLNDNVGGPGQDRNLFPITADANKKHESKVEKTVKDWVNKKRYLTYYRVKVNKKSVQIVNKNIKDPGNAVDADFECEAYPLNADNKPAPGGFKQIIQSRYKQIVDYEDPKKSKLRESLEGEGETKGSEYKGEIEYSRSKKKIIELDPKLKESLEEIYQNDGAALLKELGDIKGIGNKTLEDITLWLENKKNVPGRLASRIAKVEEIINRIKSH